MTISMTKKTAMAVLIVICGATVSRVIGQQASAPKIQPLRVVQYDGDMANLLAHLAVSFDVTIGLETDPKQPKSQVSLLRARRNFHRRAKRYCEICAEI